MKNGAPINDKIIPTGNSNVENNILANKSQIIRNTAPNNVLTIIKYLHSEPTIILAICGTISPTKPNSPEKLTQEPAKSAASNKKNRRYLLTDNPNVFAVSSPNDNSSISL